MNLTGKAAAPLAAEDLDLSFLVDWDGPMDGLFSFRDAPEAETSALPGAHPTRADRIALPASRPDDGFDAHGSSGWTPMAAAPGLFTEDAAPSQSVEIVSPWQAAAPVPDPAAQLVAASPLGFWELEVTIADATFGDSLYGAGALAALDAGPAYDMHASSEDGDLSLAAAEANGVFDIDIVYSGDPAYQTYFDQAATRWEQVITADLPDVGSIDDLRIDASVVFIDGQGDVLGQAGWDARRSGSTGLPYLGSMDFDSADVQDLVNNGRFLSVALHEIGHILGIGTLWSTFGFLVGAGSSDPVYTGSNAVREYRALTGNPSVTSIPVENQGGGGTRDSHWRETTFANELMTGYISGSTQPLSRMTIGSLQDLGYAVNYAAADFFQLPGGPPPNLGPPVITSDGGGATANLLRNENATAVTVVTATDPDGSAIAFSISGGADAARFQINATSGALSFVTAPNFEAPTDSDGNNSYIVQVSASDGLLSDTQTLTVAVADIPEVGALSINDASVTEGQAGARLLTFTVTRTGGTGAFNVNFATADGAATVADGDYLGASGTLAFGAGVNSQTVSVTINGDTKAEFSEDFFVNLSGATNGATISDSQGRGTIVNDDGQPPVKPPYDFNADLKGDILFQEADGRAAVWLMNGGGITDATVVGFNPGASWEAAGASDFGGDGKADVLFQEADGRVAIWQMNGASIVDASVVGFNPGAAWEAAGAGDFGGDGKADVLFQEADGRVAIWQMNGGSLAATNVVGFNPGAAWDAVGAGDFNGDGKADVLFQEADGRVAIWLMNGATLVQTSVVAFNPGAVWDAIRAGDFNGDGKADVLFQEADGRVAIWQMNGADILAASIVGFNPGASWDVIG